MTSQRAAERPRSAWRVLAPVLAFALVVAVAVAIRLGGGPPGAAALVLSGGVGALAIWAVVDGLRRLAGRPTFLGTGRGVDRLVGGLQVLASAGAAIALLPNTVTLLNALASLVR